MGKMPASISGKENFLWKQDGNICEMAIFATSSRKMPYNGKENRCISSSQMALYALHMSESEMYDSNYCIAFPIYQMSLTGVMLGKFNKASFY